MYQQKHIKKNSWMTKKEPKSEDHFSKFDWYDLGIFFGHNASSEPKSIIETNKA